MNPQQNPQHSQAKIIYLASKSPRRRELLKQIGVHFELLMMREIQQTQLTLADASGRQANLIIDVDESPGDGELPRQYVERVVRIKADTALRIMRSRKLAPRPILTADTTVAISDEILGKPTDAADAMRILKRLSGETHQVMTAIAVTAHGETDYAFSTSLVSFATLSDAEIKRYIETGEPMDKAGAYGIQGHAAKFISNISGSYSGVMGLPLFETAELLRKAGLTV